MNRSKHYLDPLLRPESIAVVGASERPDSVGRQTMENLLTGRYPGKLYAVNPAYKSVCGVQCFPDLVSLPENVDHVVLTVGDTHIEAALDDVITHGAKAATMMSSLVLAGDKETLLRERVAKKIASTGLIVCGANGMGFYNFCDGIWVCGWDTRDNHVRGGNVTLISHSGSGMCGIIDCEERIDFNLAVSTGQELCVTMDQYMDFALEQRETRVIGLFMETARNPDGMIAAFRKANDKGVPVVVLKVGRTELSARLAVSHSGAMAGRDDAHQAVFDRYGVQRVNDMDEMATTLIMFAQPHEVAPGGLVAIHDSGGERQLLIDLAHSMKVPLARIEPATVNRLEELLDPGLPPVNPLDAWSAGGPDSDRIMKDCLAALMADPNAAMGVVVHDRAPMSGINGEYIEYMRHGFEASGKPVFLLANRQGTGSDPAVVAATREGFPVLDGLRSFLTGVRCVFDYRDFRARNSAQITPLPANSRVQAQTIARWLERLASGDTLDEFESGQLLGDFGISTNPARFADDENSLLSAAEALKYPLVLKTAEAGIVHKTDQNGVVLNLANETMLKAAYAELAHRLGSQVVVSPMVKSQGIELVLGLVHDEQFGPLVMLGFGGVKVEVLKDVAYALPPFNPATARRMLDKLAQRPLLDVLRNRPALDIDAFCDMAGQFSLMAAKLAPVIEEIDVNPVIVSPHGCLALDALVVGRQTNSAFDPE
ncbi:MAG: acetate--CoA ligase family protein [Proteobacteria bacterium]|nr:acetate--CoA ligase family protein [Pseudomonadota bacterium]